MNHRIISSRNLGIALDGVSGGGGAVKIITRKILTNAVHSPAFKRYMTFITNVLLRETIVYLQANNGQFLGQFVGKLVSALSAVNQQLNSDKLNLGVDLSIVRHFRALNRILHKRIL